MTESLPTDMNSNCGRLLENWLVHFFEFMTFKKLIRTTINQKKNGFGHIVELSNQSLAPSEQVYLFPFTFTL